MPKEFSGMYIIITSELKYLLVIFTGEFIETVTYRNIQMFELICAFPFT